MRKYGLVDLLVLASVLMSAGEHPLSGSKTLDQRVLPRPSVPLPPTVSMTEARRHLAKRVRVLWPPTTSVAHVHGTVLLLAEVDAVGDVTQSSALAGPQMLRPAAIEAVKRYKYRPFFIHGRPTVVRIRVAVPVGGVEAAIQVIASRLCHRDYKRTLRETHRPPASQNEPPLP